MRIVWQKFIFVFNTFKFLFFLSSMPTLKSYITASQEEFSSRAHSTRELFGERYKAVTLSNPLSRWIEEIFCNEIKDGKLLIINGEKVTKFTNKYTKGSLFGTIFTLESGDKAWFPKR